jgi:outer membrane protein OmpA-like peptidoglycan-associated protein
MKIAYRLFFILLVSLFLFSCAEKKTGVEGKLLDGRGGPISATIIFKQVLPSKGYEQFEVKTNTDGSFRIEGVMPAAEYIIAPVSENWKTKVAIKITTLAVGQILQLSKPIVIRYNLMKDGTVVDTKTGLQWLILGIPDLNSSNVQNAIKNLKDGGFTDWRLPTKTELADLSETPAVPATPSATAAQPAPAAQPAAAVPPDAATVQKTCCAWVIEPTTENIEWKFYIDDGNEVWASSKVPPDDRIVVVRNYTPAVSAQTPAVATPATGSAAPEVVPATPVPGSTAPAVNLFPEKKPATEPAPKTGPTVIEKKDVPLVKNKGGVLSASRKACVAKNAQTAKSAAALPVAAQVTPAAKQSPTVKGKPDVPDNTTGDSVTIQFAMNKSGISPEELFKLKTFYAKIKDKKGKIVIEGNSGGDTADSFKISGERALSAKAMLYKLGLSKKVEVRITGLSDTKPISDNNTEAGRKLNRRADLTFIPE